MFGFLTGLALGLVFSVLGAGGGIIAVPVLLVLFALPMNDATGAGLAIVFTAALTSAVAYARARRVDWRTVLLLGPMTMIGAVGGAKLNAFIPERVTAALFAVVLLAATASLFRKKNEQPKRAPTLLLLATGLALGVLTGVLGVGGGFLLVPVLVGLASLPLHRAVGTSTALIAMSSLAGGVTTMISKPHLATIILPVAAGAMGGAVLGVPLGGKLPEKGLRIGFAALSLTVAAGMAVKAIAP